MLFANDTCFPLTILACLLWLLPRSFVVGTESSLLRLLYTFSWFCIHLTVDFWMRWSSHVEQYNLHFRSSGKCLAGPSHPNIIRDLLALLQVSIVVLWTQSSNISKYRTKQEAQIPQLHKSQVAHTCMWISWTWSAYQNCCFSIPNIFMSYAKSVAGQAFLFDISTCYSYNRLHQRNSWAWWAMTKVHGTY